MLLRETIGEVLRRHRQEHELTLRDVSSAAAVSLGYLSEVERGKKEASSELLAAICDALQLPITELLQEVSAELELAAITPLFAPIRVKATTARADMPEPVPARPVRSGSAVDCLAA